MQMICIWSSWCHCYPVVSCSSKIQNGLPFWCRLTQVFLEKRPLNGCNSSSSNTHKDGSGWVCCSCCLCVVMEDSDWVGKWLLWKVYMSVCVWVAMCVVDARYSQCVLLVLGTRNVFHPQSSWLAVYTPWVEVAWWHYARVTQTRERGEEEEEWGVDGFSGMLSRVSACVIDAAVCWVEYRRVWLMQRYVE